MKKPILSVAVMLVFKEQVFLVRRQNFLNFFPGYTTFPGGKVDPEDHRPCDSTPFATLKPEIANAVIREAHEELGIDLTAGIIGDVTPIGVAITPDINPYRFETHFIRIVLTQSPEMTVDENEAAWGKWYDLADFNVEDERGEHMMVPPMRWVLNAANENLNFKWMELTPHYPAELTPYYEGIRGLTQFVPLSNTLPPADRTNSFYYGENVKVLVDPSPKDEQEYNKFLKTLDSFKVDCIFISHHHPDHHERSVNLAIDLNVDMYMSEFTRDILLEKKGADYFQDRTIHLLKEGDSLGDFHGEEVKIMEVPGHDEGQLALYPTSLKWFFAGDLFQGVGTVVIPEREGSMLKYFQTLKKVIKLNPKTVFPSHGIGLGGVNILEFVLKHRTHRETTILDFYQQGKSETEILQLVYPDLDKGLHRLALLNIYSHLTKLHEEGIISWQKPTGES
jgi:ribonuclease/clavin/mitogillin